MGVSKAMMEKVAVAKSKNGGDTIINVTRYGNVMLARVSNSAVYVADSYSANYNNRSRMTRFMMTLDEAVDLVPAFQNGRSGEILF